VPEELATMLTTSGNRRVEYRPYGEDDWRQDENRIDNWLDAYVYALAVVEEIPEIAQVRVTMDTEA